MNPVDEICELLERRGGANYGGERVSQLEHALQCATLAEEAGADAALITAALLHDIGHLVHDLGNPCPDWAISPIRTSFLIDEIVPQSHRYSQRGGADVSSQL